MTIWRDQLTPNNVPFLEITPVRFKDTGYFIKTKILNDQILCEVKYKVRNIGNTDAIDISSDVVKGLINLEPGQQKFFTISCKVEKGDSNQESPQAFLDLIEKEDTILKIKQTIFFHFKSNITEKIRMETTHKIGKNNIILIGSYMFYDK